jgi:cell division septation protein DedD
LKATGLIIIGILLFILGFLYGRERAVYYPPEIRGEVEKPAPREAKKKFELKEKLFTLQAGSFEKKEHAEELFQELQKKGYPVFLEKADLKGKGVWYRVKLGEFSTRAEAEKFREELGKEEQGLKESIIIPF